MRPLIKESAGRVGIVDDQREHRDDLGLRARIAGFDPFLFNDRLGSPGELVQGALSANLYGVICDHRLREGDYATFDGAEAVAALYDARIPAVLVTDYSRVDVDGEIRLHRRKVPVVIPTPEADDQALAEGLAACDREVRGGDVPVTRRGRRSIVLIDEVREGLGGKQVVAFVPQWNPEEAVSFPLSLVPDDLRRWVRRGGMLLASVNIDAERGEELFFENFELPPQEKSER